MKFLCEKCARLVAVHEFRVDGLALVLVCPECGTEARSEVTAHATGLKVVASNESESGAGSEESDAEVVDVRADPRFDPPENACPKCITPHPSRAPTCERCGLVFANAEPSQFRPSERLRQTWIEVCERWGEASMHTRVLEQAVAENSLAALARLYRIRLARTPNDAQAQLRVAQLVERISSQALSVHEPAQNLRWVGWVALVVFAIVLLLVILVSLSH